MLFFFFTNRKNDPAASVKRLLPVGSDKVQAGSTCIPGYDPGGRFSKLQGAISEIRSAYKRMEVIVEILLQLFRGKTLTAPFPF